LKGLQTDGIVKKTVSMDRPLQIVYELTPKGLSLAEIIPYLVIWTGIVDPYKKVNAQYPNCKIINRQ
ncbi:winged helix-turn-helix transcriptional regulator, partial [Klebsiella pneumoniae]